MIAADLENITDLQPQDGCDDRSFPYLCKVKCGRCGEVSPKETYVTLNDTVPVPASRGIANLVQKFCGREGTVLMVPGKGKPPTLDMSETGKNAPLMMFDCRGWEPEGFIFHQGGRLVKSGITPEDA